MHYLYPCLLLVVRNPSLIVLCPQMDWNGLSSKNETPKTRDRSWIESLGWKRRRL